MVIHNLHLVGAIIAPYEANPPLIIDADRVLPGSVPQQGFQAVARRGTKIIQRLCRVQDGQLPPRGGQNIRGETLGHPVGEYLGCALVGEAADHALCVA